MEYLNKSYYLWTKEAGLKFNTKKEINKTQK
jgi:hypothetical protein